jgi:tRNA (guanine37-N1)-methyltransferase
VRVDIVTIFPDYFGTTSAPEPPSHSERSVAPASSPPHLRIEQGSGPLGVSLIGKAAARGDVDFRLHDLRTWASDVHHTVDDTPFGGGPGMVMKPDVWGAALDDILRDGGTALGSSTAEGSVVKGTVVESAAPARLIVPTPSGTPFTQGLAAAYAAEKRLVFACGRYEGIDSRVVADARSAMAVDEVSIGDYVLAGGEAAVCVILEAVCRLLPGVLGNEQSAADDSFGGGGGEEGDLMRGLLEGPVYTRPRSWRGREVPPVLLSGDHKAIARWRRDEALRRTAAVRPDLVSRMVSGAAGGAGALDARDRTVLAEAGFPVDGESMAH